MATTIEIVILFCARLAQMGGKMIVPGAGQLGSYTDATEIWMLLMISRRGIYTDPRCFVAN